MWPWRLLATTNSLPWTELLTSSRHHWLLKRNYLSVPFSEGIVSIDSLLEPRAIPLDRMDHRRSPIGKTRFSDKDIQRKSAADKNLLDLATKRMQQSFSTYRQPILSFHSTHMDFHFDIPIIPIYPLVTHRTRIQIS